ncbi:MAG: TauD/TfdA family dioxygenase, partial [Pseudomonadales bacterium]|nr:TauD/TfdA family dioxygenase [Pseudomonadales bacterium]
MSDSYRRIEVEPLTPGIGAIVHGVDLGSPLDDGLFQEIHDAWMRHLVLFMRDQHMSPAQHLAFGRRFGDLHIHPAAPYAHDDPALMVIHTDKDSRRNNG